MEDPINVEEIEKEMEAKYAEMFEKKIKEEMKHFEHQVKQNIMEFLKMNFKAKKEIKEYCPSCEKELNIDAIVNRQLKLYTMKDARK